jgi:hypothetical protein
MSKEESVIYISPKINSRIMEYAQAASGEISGFGSINPHTNIVDKLFPLMSQECSGSETEINPKMITEFVTSGQSATANLWWHSHVMMGCFWSKTDDECIEALGRTMNSLLSIVVNKKREYKARFDLFRPIRITVDISLLYYYEFPYAEIEKIRTEVKDKVKVKTYASVVVPNNEPFKRVSRFPKSKDLHGMTESELNQYGYKLVNGNQIVLMSAEEYVKHWDKIDKERKNGAKNGNGSEQSNAALELFGASDIPPYPPNWDRTE